MKINYYTGAFIAILLIGIFLRFYNIQNFGTFGHDNSRDLILTYKMFQYQEWQYRGPVFSLVWAHLSPIYYYLIFPFYFVMGFHPLAPAITSSILNIIALILVWWVTKEVFGKSAALIAASIYAISLLVIIEGAFGLNPCFMPMFAVLLLYGIFLKSKKDNWIGSLIISFCLAMLVSFHPSGFFAVPIVVITLLILRLRFKIKELLYSGLIFLFAAILPYAYQQKKFNGWDIIKVQEYLNAPKAESVNFVDYMNNFFEILNLNISKTLFYSEASLFIIISTIVLVAIFYHAIQIYKKQEFINILAFMIATYCLIFGFVMKFSVVGTHAAWFQSVLIPWIIIYIAAALVQLNYRAKYFVVLGLLLLIFTQNLFNYFNYESGEDKFYAQKQIYENLRSDSDGRDFDIYGEDSQPFLYMMWFYEPESELKEKYFSWIKWSKANGSNLVYYLDTKAPVTEEFIKIVYGMNKVKNVEKIFTFQNRSLYRIDE